LAVHGNSVLQKEKRYGTFFKMYRLHKYGSQKGAKEKIMIFSKIKGG
jgi:hypothetical protein